MSLNRLRDAFAREDHGEPDGWHGPRIVDGGEVAPAAPWTGHGNGVREVRNYQVRPHGQKDKGTRDALSGGLLSLAGAIIAASAVGAGYVAYESQRLFALAHVQGHHRENRAAIVAALPDAGWGSMAIVALVAALRARSSLRARVGVLIFFALSLAAQVMYAPRTDKGALDPKAILVAVIAPVTLAWMLETFIVEVRRWVASRRGLDIEESPIITSAVRGMCRGIRGGAGIPLWFVRLCVDRKGTWNGAKDWLLDELPLAPGRTRASLRADAAVEQAGTAEQVAEQARQEATARIEQARADAARLVEEIRQQETQARERLVAEKAELADVVEGLRRQVEALSAKTAKERLWFLYDDLGRRGDDRFADKAKVAEVARELFELAGMRSEGTARTYLYEYIEAHGAQEGRGTSDQRVMIGGKA